MNQSITDMWNDFHFKLKSKLITEDVIRLALKEFNKHLLKVLDQNQLQILVMFKVKRPDTIAYPYKSISKLHSFYMEEFHIFEDLCLKYWEMKTEDYHSEEYSEIIFSYKIPTSDFKVKRKSKLNIYDRNVKMALDHLNYTGLNIPNTMDFSTWGKIQWYGDNAVVFKNYSPGIEYHIQLFDNYQIVDVKSNDNIIITFKDIMNDKRDLSYFTRILSNQEYIFEDGQLKLKKAVQKVPFLTKLKANTYNSKAFITMDLETRVINNVMTSYCVSIYDGKQFQSFYLADYESDKEMLTASIRYLMRRKYHNHIVYLHNFSKFDAIFILSIMTDLCEDVKPLIKDNKFIDLKIKFNEKYVLRFRDSLLLLPSSLRNLAKEFKVDNKGIFPYKFVNDISLTYKGAAPNFNYFDNVTKDEYDIYAKNYNNNWDLRKETIKYCELDCLVLYQILDKFSNYIYELFYMDMLKYPTLSSLAFAIFRAQFLGDSKIPLLQGKIYDFIKQSYTGGAVDVFQPTSEGKVYRYDVNSLYPYVMKEFPMPSGTPIYFEGDILQYEKNSHFEKRYGKPYGIFEADITAPPNLKIPLLQTKIKTKNGHRTIAPLGNWTGVYFSEELYNAEKYGYRYKIKKGYLFQKSNLFSEYVDYLYDLKKNSERDSPFFIISKLLLNGLYGRFGMTPESEEHIIVTPDEGLKIQRDNNKIVNAITVLSNGKELISFFNLPDNSDKMKNKTKNISVVVASIVTASARIHMSQFKNNNNYTVYYSDTDSLDINRELDPKFIGKELGQMKLEHVFEEAVFLAPKMYGGINQNYEYVRIKGLKNPIKFNELKSLIKKDMRLGIPQEKWYSDLTEGVFHVKNEILTLMVTDNKRKLIYNDNNEFVNTAPFKLINGELIE